MDTKKSTATNFNNRRNNIRCLTSRLVDSCYRNRKLSWLSRKTNFLPGNFSACRRRFILGCVSSSRMYNREREKATQFQQCMAMVSAYRVPSANSLDLPQFRLRIKSIMYLPLLPLSSRVFPSTEKNKSEKMRRNIQIKYFNVFFLGYVYIRRILYVGQDERYMESV